MRIALDAMGSDLCPVPDVAGAVMAARESGDAMQLVGDKIEIQRELDKYDVTGLNLEVVHAEQAVVMTDKPSVVAKEKPNSSMHVGLRRVKEGRADAFVTVGNTGAVQAIAMLYTLHRIPGVKRPALSAIFHLAGRPTIFVDIGANADCRPEWLVQFAMMGRVYAEKALGLANPRIALLSNGEEEGKGNQLVRDSTKLLHETALNFVGNVEPKEVLTGIADVVVSEGFTGNILVKTFEASVRYVGNLIRDETRYNVLSMVGALIMRPALRRVRNKLDTSEIGGAPLLGVNGVVIIGHGSSSANAVKNAIHQARRAVAGALIEGIREGISQLPRHGKDETH
jgi:glycerol-3-phosphate acyltransferase PlsX